MRAIIQGTQSLLLLTFAGLMGQINGVAELLKKANKRFERCQGQARGLFTRVKVACELREAEMEAKKGKKKKK